MTITELKYVVALAKERHFGRAADRVYVSQPTLSIGIKKLEDELEVKLFERLAGKVIPTIVGEKIIAIAEEALASTDLIRSVAQHAKGDLVGNIKLGIIFSMCPYLLPKMLPLVKRQAPELNIFVDENYTKDLIEKLKEGLLDIAITSLPVEKSPLINVREIYEEDFVVILPEEHKLESKKKLSFDDLKTERIFILGSGNCFGNQVFASCHENFTDKRVHQSDFIAGGSLETIRVMVKSNMGISVFPEMAVKDSAEGLVVKRFSLPIPSRKIALVYRSSFIQEDVVDTIEQCLKACLV